MMEPHFTNAIWIKKKLNNFRTKNKHCLDTGECDLVDPSFLCPLILFYYVIFPSVAEPALFSATNLKKNCISNFN